jgi:hypothetical protein
MPPTLPPKKEQIQRAIAQVSDRAPAVAPEIDFTVHLLEDGTSVSTQERMIKDVCHVFVIGSSCFAKYMI